MLEPVRDSYRTGKSLEWTRVNDLPDFVYFNHSIHINKGVGCNTCHGPVDRMPMMFNNASLQMEWCLDCHREPEKNLRPRDQVFNMRYEPPDDQLDLGRRLCNSSVRRGRRFLRVLVELKCPLRVQQRPDFV